MFYNPYLEMKSLIIFYICSIASIHNQSECQSVNESLITDVEKAKRFLQRANEECGKEYTRMLDVLWTYSTDINEHTSAAQMNSEKAYNEFARRIGNEAKLYDWSLFDEQMQSQFEHLAIIGTAALDKDDQDQYIKATNQMNTIYSTAKVCVSTRGCDLDLEPDLEKIMATSRNHSELLETWINWRNAAGKPLRSHFITAVNLGNKAAKMNRLPNKEFQSLDELWLNSWKTPDIVEQVTKILQQIKPFYDKLHAYVRMKLRDQYPNQMPADGTIPAHLLGNMWAQSWENTMNTTRVDPFPELPPIDVTQAMLQQRYTPLRMFQMADRFFSSLGLDKMTDTFWKKSLFVKPTNKTIVCHASAWDFNRGDDYRIKQCTEVDMSDLITIHHEMGHIQYFMQYKDQPFLFHRAANPGFHEAIGDLIALSVATPKHLQRSGLLATIDRDDLNKINLKFQLKMALDKLMFLPYSYIMDKWRWDVFSGRVSFDQMNRHWWRLRGRFQGVSPPVKRSEHDFDPGCKYHIAANSGYLVYFVAHVLQFQFHKKLCSFRERFVPLHECDIDSDREAGLALKQMLRKGSSEKWTKQLQEFTGSGVIDVQPMLDYFKPLDTFLTKQLEGQSIGWIFNVDDYFMSSPSAANTVTIRLDVTSLKLFIGSVILSIICY